MNREEILNMPAGREMDALVLMELFGVMAFRDSNGQPYKIGAFQENEPVPNYSTDMTAAWEIVKKLPKGEFTIELGARTILATFFGYKNGSAVVRDNEDAAPLAICRAALLTTLED